MKVEIISIGDELLIGKTINTNAAWIGEELSKIGFTINKVTTISDSKDAISQSLELAILHNQVVLITGGLGPTNDDITKHVLCDFFDTSLEINEDAYKNIEKFVLSRGGDMNQNNKNQALFPKKAQFIANNCGTASGMWFTHNNCIIVSMPGVPFEMTAMMTESIIPKLQSIFTLPTIIHRHILVTGIAESKLAHTISNWEQNLPKQIKLAYLPSPGIVKLRLSCTENNIELAQNLIKIEELKLHTIIGNNIFGYDNDTLEQIVGKLLLSKNATISTAESCTGGAISHAITSVSGSSDYYMGSIIAYNNWVKVNELNIDENIINLHGAVSKQVVELMAINCRNKFKTDYAIASSGIAGPLGGTTEKPIGTVWLAVANAEQVISMVYNFGENRERTVLRSTIAALNMLQKLID